MKPPRPFPGARIVPIAGATRWELHLPDGTVVPCRRVECWDRSHEPVFRLPYRGGQICLDPVDQRELVL